MGTVLYQIADTIEYDVLVCTGQSDRKPVVTGHDSKDNVLDMLLRSDPANALLLGYDADDPTQWIYVGGANNQVFPLKSDQSINFRVKRRSDIYFRGPSGHKLIMLTAKRTIGAEGEPAVRFSGGF